MSGRSVRNMAGLRSAVQATDELPRFCLVRRRLVIATRFPHLRLLDANILTGGPEPMRPAAGIDEAIHACQGADLSCRGILGTISSICQK